jgi:RND family efflux transporter MFP subunit
MKVIIPVVVLVVGGGLSFLVGHVDSAPARDGATRDRLPVRVADVTVPPAEQPSVVTATGVVRAAQQVALAAEVSGRIVTRSSALIPGGRVSKGQVLVRLDSRDYRLALQQEQARVQRASLELRTEKSRQVIAEREWQFLGREQSQEEADFVLRRPHLAAAHAALASAESGVARARLNVDRTVVRAPFNAVVQQAQAEVGQLVGAGTTMATLVGADQLWVRVSVPVERLPDVEVPGVNGDRGSEAKVLHDLGGGRRVERRGVVLRLEGQLAEETRTATLLVAVNNPLDEPAGAIPLLPGTMVTVELEGRPLEGVFEVPQAALHNGDTLWVVDGDDRLARRQVRLRWAREDRIFVTSDELNLGDRVVTSPLARPLTGQEVRLTTGPVGEGEGANHDDQG